MVDSGKLTNLTLAAHLVHVGRVIKEKATGILVSPGIKSWESEKLGFIAVNHPQKALELALKLAGRQARIGVL